MTDGVERLGSCPLCNGTRPKVLPVPGRQIGHAAFDRLRGSLGLVRCRDCSLVYINPRPSAERLSAFYSSDTYPCHDAAGSSSAGGKADYLLNLIERHFPADAPKTLLDYGAGGGGFLLDARRRGWLVRGFEPGRRGMETCRAAGLDVTNRLEDLPPATFGLVTLHHVFEHIANPGDTLDLIRPLVAPGGRLFIEVPNVKSLRARMAAPFLSQRYPVDERHRAFPVHLMYYSVRTLRAMLAKSGWVTESTFTVGMGVDRFFLRPEPVAAEETARANNPSPPHPLRRAGKRKLRHRIRDAFLGAGLGENLAVLARPASPPPIARL